MFAGKRFADPYSGRHKNLSYRLVRYLPSKVLNVFSRRVFVPPIDLLTFTKSDLVIFTNFVRTPLPLGAKSISFIYDLSFMLYGEHAGKKNRQIMLREAPKSARNSDSIITISQNSKDEIIKHYKIDPSKISIVYPALYHDEYYPRSLKEKMAVAKKLNIPGKYILFTGTIEPRKNIIGVIDSYMALPKKIRNNYALVLAGGKGWNDQDICKRLKELKDEKIIVTGYVTDKDMPALYSGASVFVFPTFYEGWGMPVVEAMACGVPVITSNNSSMPEAGGNAALFVEAKDTKDIAKKIEQVLSDEKLAKDMTKKGIAHAGKFSWQKSAKDLKKVIDQVLAK
jgi:glycosyltransferase involved in cell wall biosynthesis